MIEGKLRVRPAGDAALVIDVGDEIDRAVNRRVHALAFAARRALEPFGPVEVTPGYTNILVSYDPSHLSYERVIGAIESVIGQPEPLVSAARRFTIPVVYGGAYGPDLDDVARYHSLTPEAVVAFHADRDYLIFCLGFSPGFPLLGGLDSAIHTPRLETPRPRVPAGSVAIGGSQTGVYPTSTPGGWRLIGRTPAVLFDLHSQPPVPYSPQDVVRFEVISAAEYDDRLAQRRMPEGETLPAGTSGPW